MGLEQFFSWVGKQNFKASMRSGLPAKSSGFYFDFPGIIHEAFGKVMPQIINKQNEDFSKKQAKKKPEVLKNEVFEVVISLIMKYVTFLTPKDVLYIGFDGSVPIGKMIQQRKRRYSKNVTTEYPLDNIVITPGSEFMTEISEYVKVWLENNHRILPDKVIFSPVENSGEAEHKIFQYMKENDTRDRHPEGYGNIILGDDWDLFLMSMLSNVKRLYLMRKTMDHFIDIDNVRENIKSLLNNSRTAIYDFAFIVISSGGNDFIPKIESMKMMDISLNVLIQTYNKVNLPLTSDEGNNILWNNVETYFKEVAKVEKEFLLPKVVLNNWKFPSQLYKDSIEFKYIGGNEKLNEKSKYQEFLNYDKFIELRKKEHVMLHGLSKTDIKEIMNYGNENIVDLILNPSDEIIEQDIKNQCFQFLTTASWILAYFKGGQYSVNETYYRYIKAPLAADIHNFLVNNKEYMYNVNYKSEGHPPPSLLIQLPIVIPPKYINYLYDDIRPLFSKKSGISDMMPEKINIVLDGIDKEFLGEALIPFPVFDRLFESIIKNIKVNKNNLKFYSQRENTELITTSKESKQLIIKDKKSSTPVKFLKPVFGNINIVK